MSKGGSSSATPAAPVPGDLGRHLGAVTDCYRSRLEEALAGMPGGLRGFQVVSAVVHHAPENQQALGAHLRIDRTVLTYLLDTLVEAGDVERVPDPGDRRARKVVVTRAGRERLARSEALAAAVEQQLLAGLEDSDARAFQGLIGRLAAFVQGSPAARAACAGLVETNPAHGA